MHDHSGDHVELLNQVAHPRYCGRETVSRPLRREGQAVQHTERHGAEPHSTNLETVAWGLFFIMAGAFLLVPGGMLPRGSWLVGVGVLLLGLNLARRLTGA